MTSSVSVSEIVRQSSLDNMYQIIDLTNSGPRIAQTMLGGAGPLYIDAPCIEGVPPVSVSESLFSDDEDLDGDQDESAASTDQAYLARYL